MSDVNALGSAVDSMRLDTSPEAAAIRARRQQAALRVLEQTGNTDLAEVPGLVPTPRKRKPAPVTANKARRPIIPCPECGTEFSPHTDEQKTCSRACGTRRSYRTRQQNGTVFGGTR